MKVVMCLAGSIASGKSTVAHALASELPGAAIRSFGDVVRCRAGQYGLPLSRVSLQTTGMALIAKGWPAFVAELLHDIPENVDVLIVDGIRHVEPIEELRCRFPSATVRTVYLDIDEVTVRYRLRERREVLDVLKHDVESSVHRIKEYADLVVDGTQPITTIVATLKTLVR